MNVEVFSDARALARELAGRVLDAVDARPSLVIALPTGRTPWLFYAALREQSAARGTDWTGVRTFNLDEFAGVPPDHPGSYRAYMERELFAPVGLASSRIGFLDGMAPDLDAECDRYERAIATAGGLDLAILGIGVNGHIGFNEPAEALQARTHVTRLESATRAANAYLFEDDATRVPARALSMGMATILQARAVVLMATGAAKARAVDAMLRGPITTAVPASFLQLHPAATILLDEAASAP